MAIRSRSQGRVHAGENVVPRGAEARAGAVLLERGMRLNDAAIALAASVGKSRLQVYKRPRVAVLTTGDEIVEVDASPGPTQIRNSNSYSLAVQIRAGRGEPCSCPSHPTNREDCGDLIEEGLKSDLLLLTGGVSMGRYDLVEQVLVRICTPNSSSPAPRIQPDVLSCSASVRAAQCSTAGNGNVFLRPPGQSRFDHGDLRTLRAPDDRGAGGNVSAETGVSCMRG